MKKRLKWKKLFIFIFIILCLIGLSVSIYNIIKWKIDSNKTEKQITEIRDDTTVKEVDDTENTEIINQEEILKTNSYWDYIKMKLIDVNFNELKSINIQTKGWIQVNGTNINYPFVQADDNKYYLTHSFDKSYNNAGWVFLDYRNKPDDKNTIIYAHSRVDRTMFGSLKTILTNGWLNNSDNYVIKLSTEYENTLWQVFSVYHIPTTSDYLETSFNNNDNFLRFINMLKNRSSHDFNTNVSASDRILTLSNCYNDFDKVVLHAKLIKREAR